MEERIEQTDEPVTPDRIASDLADLGVAPGDTLLVHSSLSSLGWVTAGQPAVIDALMEAVTPEGTIVMPTHSTQYCDPSYWQNPAVPDDWEDVIRSERPPYRPAVTPTWNVGAIPECFRTYPQVHRSRHPTYSLAAWGRGAAAIVAGHSYAYGLGEESPLAELYDRDADVLMLGTGYDTNTSLHLAEHRADREEDVSTHTTTVLDGDGDPTTITYDQLSGDTDDFPDLGSDFEADHPEAVTEGQVGMADAKLVSQPELVDYAASWFEENRE
jgi:aminoglycoside 3-N-acetyltransferase